MHQWRVWLNQSMSGLKVMGPPVSMFLALPQGQHHQHLCPLLMKTVTAVQGIDGKVERASTKRPSIDSMARVFLPLRTLLKRRCLMRETETEIRTNRLKLISSRARGSPGELEKVKRNCSRHLDQISHQALNLKLKVLLLRRYLK